MRLEHCKDIYELFEKFIQDFLIDKNSILTDDNDILTKEGIDDCLTRYNENYDNSSASFDEKVINQFNGAPESHKLIFAHAEWLWAYAVDDISIGRKRYYAERILEKKLPEDKNDIFPVGFGSAGQWHTNNKYWEIIFNLKCIRAIQNALNDKILEPKVDSIKEWYEAVCLFVKYGTEAKPKFIPTFEFVKDGGQLAQANIILHVCYPDKYERIASNNHKNRIANSFDSLIPKDKKNKDLNTDERIFLIRQELSTILDKPNENLDFYQDEFQRIWNYSLTDEGYDEVQGLQYKKAIILYGPPGTSKTHSARSLAKSLITDEYLSDRDNVVKFFKEEEDFTKDRIHYLQLHPNYTYEDFVAGYQLKNHATEAVKGKLLKICKEAAKDKKKAHVLILDEINRIDLSRLFGEVFSALENRDVAIELSIGDFELTIPSNLYVIGTMNEIDFSLERIDFALRRRFLWFFYGYDSNTLKSIIKQKNKAINAKLRIGEEVERFIRNATDLNNRISNIPELGRQYQIGHTFFGEIVDIYKGFIDITGRNSNQLKAQIYRNDGATNILWDISLKPMIESFLGNMDVESRNSILTELKSIYEKK